MGRTRWIKPAALAVLAAAAVTGSIALGGAEGLSRIPAWASLEQLVSENLVAALAVYAACTVVGCTVLVLPGMVFALAAGALFGPVVGTLSCLAAATVAAVLAFLAGRFFLRDAVQPRALAHPLLRRWLFEPSGTGAVVTLMITRLVPLFPYNLQNFAYGVTDMRLSTYALCTLVFMLPGTALYALAGAGVAAGSRGVLCLAAGAVIAVATLILAALLRKRYLPDAGEGVSRG